MRTDKQTLTGQSHADTLGARTRPWLWLTAPIVILVVLVSAVGLTVPNVYRGSLSWVVQGVAQDFMDLVVVLPVLVVGGLLTARGSWRGRLVWLGALSYLVYTFVIYTASVSFNSLFLVYVAVLGCSLWALIGGMATTDWGEIRSYFQANRFTKVVSILLLIQVLLFYMTWLQEDIPAVLNGTIPPSVQANGTPTNIVHVLDMSTLLPAIALCAIWLWRERTIAYGLTGLLLTNMVYQGLNVVVIMLFSMRAGLAGSAGLIAVFLVIAILDLVLLAWHLSKMTPMARPARFQIE